MKKMLADLHAHTSGISKCCRIAAPEVIKCAQEKGIDALALTNHYQKSYVEDGDAVGFARRYAEEFEYTKQCGDKAQFKVFFGIEVTMERHAGAHMLIYGVDTDFITQNPLIYDYTQKELYDLVKENGGVLIQAHPFRNGMTVLDTAYMDGIEINCHPLYQYSYSQEIMAIAKEKKLAVTCGGDYHADTYRPKCGVYLPDSINDSIGLGEYIAKAEDIGLCVHEIGQECAKTVYPYRD